MHTHLLPLTTCYGTYLSASPPYYVNYLPVALEGEPLLELLAERARLEGGATCLEAMECARPRGPHLVGQSALLRLQLQRMRTPPPHAAKPEAEAAALAAAAAALETWYRASGALLIVRSRASRESAVQLQWLHLRRQAAQRPSLLLRERGGKDGIHDKSAYVKHAVEAHERDKACLAYIEELRAHVLLCHEDATIELLLECHKSPTSTGDLVMSDAAVEVLLEELRDWYAPPTPLAHPTHRGRP